jgi:HEAT repeat protein
MDREELIQKIIEEKGVSAIPKIVDLLSEEDVETRELARDILEIMGAADGKDYLFEEFKNRFDLNEDDDISLLYLAEILADFECKEIIPYLERMINNFSDERAFPIIYENLLKLTKDEKYLEYIETYIDDGGELEEISIMAMTNMPSKRVVNNLISKYKNTNSNSIRALVLDSLVKVLLSDFELVSYLREIEPEISEKISWQLQKS